MTTGQENIAAQPPSHRSGAHRTFPRAPVRIVHLGLGNFFRAHQAWYTGAAPDAAQWGIAAFTGNSRRTAEILTAQDGLYTLITRGADGDSAEIQQAITAARSGADHGAWLAWVAHPAVAMLTMTVTEAGYTRLPDGGLDIDNRSVVADLDGLRAGPDAALRTAPARLVAGLGARRSAGAGPIAVVSCDNLPGNGTVAAQVVGQVAGLVDRSLAGWIEQNVSFVTTMVDRITPATTAEDAATAQQLTGWPDAAPVVTEPYREWVLSGHFPAGRPAWEAVGARFVDDIGPFEERKLALLNGGHSLLAYAGGARGHQTVADAVADPVCRGWLEQFWSEASGHLTLPAAEIEAYRAALLTRFGNAQIRHLLAQIAADGSQKLPIRILPTVRAEWARGRVAVGALRVVAAWVRHLRGAGVPVIDALESRLRVFADGWLETAVPAVLSFLDPELAAIIPIREVVLGLAQDLGDVGAVRP